jgi:hypothetical protein
MQGLEVARRFFIEWGQPYVQRRFPGLANRMAAGLFRGSQVLEADDEWSRDHGWGPMFTVFLPEADYAIHGEELARTLDTEAPREWLGYHIEFPKANVEATTIDRYCEYWLGYATPPSDAQQWLGWTPHSGAREHELYLMRHGQVFADPLDEVAARRAAFAQYPEWAWVHRIWEETFNVWHYGQYNFCERLVHRHDRVAAQIALGSFAEAVMRLGMLLEHDYSPYWKWLAHEFRKQPIAMRLDEPLRQACESQTLDEQARRVEEVCHIVHGLLEEANLASSDLTSHPHSLFRDHTALRARLDAEQANKD